MPVEQAFENLRQAIANAPAVNVLLASEIREERTLQKLNLRADLAAEFLAAARQSSQLTDGDVLLRPYDPGYKPEPQEILYIELNQNPEVASIVDAFSQVQQAELFKQDAEVVDHLKFYGIVVSPTANSHAVFFRSYTPTQELTRKGVFAAFLNKGHYNKLETGVFLFDRQIDCFSWNGYLFIRNVTAFQRIFKYFEQLRARASQIVDTILVHVPVSNADQFRASCLGQIQMIAKLSQIAAKPYLTTVTMADIRRTIEAFHLDLQIDIVDGEEKLVFESTPNRRWLILKLLDDAYLGSIMTNRLYEANSKSDI